MPDRDWDKELAKIDKQLASLSDDALLGPTPVQIPAKGKAGVPAKSAPAPKAEKKVAAVRQPTETKAWAVYLRLLIAIALGVGIFWWPYPTRCGAGLAGYLAVDVAVIVGGLWSAVWTWKHRAARSHTLSLLIVLLGMVLGAIQVLPRVGYGRPDANHPASWTCEQAPAPSPQTGPKTIPPASTQPAGQTPPKTTP